jgi:hypothetical protein
MNLMPGKKSYRDLVGLGGIAWKSDGLFHEPRRNKRQGNGIGSFDEDSVWLPGSFLATKLVAVGSVGGSFG